MMHKLQSLFFTILLMGTTFLVSANEIKSSLDHQENMQLSSYTVTHLWKRIWNAFIPTKESIKALKLQKKVAQETQIQQIINGFENKTPVTHQQKVDNSALFFRRAEVTECFRTASCEADAEQFDGGNNFQNCAANNVSDLEMGELGSNDNVVGLNFAAWNIPQGATIISARIQFTAERTTRGAANFIIRGVDRDNPVDYSAGDDVITRPLTSNLVTWQPPDWAAGSANVAQLTPDLTDIIQEIVNRPTYALGNNIGIHIEGSGLRSAVSYDINPAQAPQLCITYDVPDPSDPPPPIECDGCSEINISSLQGVPNFPQVDVLNVCSAPDTVSLLVYNAGDCPVTNMQITVNFDNGLAYGGFVESHNAGQTVSEFNVADGSNPVFLVEQLDTGKVIIVNFGMTGDCSLNLENDDPLNFDVNIDFFSNTSSNGVLKCNVSQEEIGEFNSGIKVPVVNVLSIDPASVDLANFTDEFCQQLVVSQDGIEATLDHVSMTVENLDLGGTVSLGSIRVNGNVVPGGWWSYDAGTEILSLRIGQNFFNQNTGGNTDNFFNENERLTVDFCYRASGCVDPTQFITYNAFYGCNNDICFDISSKQGTLDSEADFSANVNASASFNQAGQICGNDFLFDFTISSDNSQPLEGLWKNLIIKFNACNTSFSEVTAIAIGGTPLPSNLWSENNGAITINTTSNTTPIGNLVDQDGDGRYDDLLGGTSLTFNVTMDVTCSDDPSCGTATCSIEQIEVNGTRDCGQSFQEFAPITPPITYGYGETSFITYDIIQTNNNYYENDYATVPCDEWGPAPNGFRLDYTYGTDNIAPCTNSNVYARITLDNHNWDMWRDIRYEAGSATYNGAPVNGVTFEYILDQNGDTTQIDVVIPAGDPNATNHAYYFNIETSGDCRPNRNLWANWEIVEECPDCTGGDCEILRSCHSVLTLIRWSSVNCVCDCEFATHTTNKRLTYGHTDCNLTTPLTEASIPAQDLNRFMPGDIMEITGTAEILDVNALRDGTTQWSFYIDGPHINSEGAWDNMNAVLDNLYFQKAGSNVRQPLIPTCILDEFPANGQLHYDSPNRDFRVLIYGLGVSHRNPDDGSNCIDYSNAAANYPFDQTSATGYRYTDGSSGHSGYELFTGVQYNDVNHSNDFYDSRIEVHFQFGNNLTCDGALYNEDADACANSLVDAFNMENGDSIHMVVRVPIAANGFHKLDFPDYKTEESRFFVNTYDQRETNCNSTIAIGGSCWTETPYQVYIPEVDHTTEVTVNDCNIEVEHTIFIANPLPTVTAGQLPWYENEYRGAIGVEWIEPFFPTNMIYDGSMVIEDMNGVQTPIANQWIDDSKGNLHCEPDGFGGVCCVAADNSDYARLHIFDQAYIDAKAHTDCYLYAAYNEPHINRHLDPFPLLPVSGAEDCFYKIKYTLTALCPEDLLSSDFGLKGQFSHVYVPDWFQTRTIANYLADPTKAYNQNIGLPFPTNGRETLNENGDPLGTSYWPFGPDPDLFSDHPSRFETNEITTPDNFDDFSNGFPPLLAGVDRLLIADEAGANERVTYELCAGNSAGATHDYVSATVEVPLSIELIDIQSLSGSGNTYSLVETTPTHNIYVIEMRDLAPGACDEIEITTELTFCPTGTNADTRINIKANSGCLPVAKSSQLLAGLEVCNAVETDYEYIREEADIQAEWDPNPAGEYGLCDELSVGTRIKNVKPAVLTDIETRWWFPDGLEFKPGTWQVCYPGGPANYGPCVNIPDPTMNSSENSAFGEYFEYTDDAIWSSYINSNGLKGVASSLDSNKVAFRFDVETLCDEFISGTSIWFQADAADPCEGRVQSMQVQSNPVIIENANPLDFAQFFVFADPTEAYCGNETVMDLTFLNISPLGFTQDSEVCIELEGSVFDYTPGSLSWISPIHSPNIVETTSGAVTKICMDVPDGIGPNEVFKLELAYTVPDDVACGDQHLNIQVTTTVEDQVCSDPPSNCDVKVTNSVNPILDIEFSPPLPVSREDLFVRCTSGGGMVDICYEVEVGNINDVMYADNFDITLIRDIDGNASLDHYDPILVTETTPVIVPPGDNRIVSNCFTVNATDACPVFMQVTQNSPCVCETKLSYHPAIEPEPFAALNDQVNLCPNSTMSFESCDDWTYSVSPSAGGTFTDDGAGNMVFSLASGYGLDSPVKIQVTSAIGACDPETFEKKVYSLSAFNLGPYTATEVCETDCQQLDLNILAQYRDNVSVSWSPTTFLDDPTSQTPTICQPTSDITYTVTVTFTEDGQTCDFTQNFPVDMIEQPVVDVIPDGKLCSVAESTFTAPPGFDTYEWLYLNDDGTESFVAAGPSNELYTETVGFYYVLYYNATDVCKTRSEDFELEYCIDYGDLPDVGAGTGNLNYETDTLNNGPAHDVEEGFYLGSRVDDEYNGQPDGTATGDGLDEDGITFPSNIHWTQGSHVRIPFSVNNPSGQQAELEIWIDWNGDGDFDDPDEWVVDISDNGFGDFGRNGYLTIYVPESISPDTEIGFRARLSHTDNMTPNGRINSGEVEDYLLRIDCDNVCLPVRSSMD